MERRILIDDLDRTSLRYDEDVEIVYLTIEDVEFRVDLKQAHIKELYEALLPYLRVSRRCGGPAQLPERLRTVLGDRVPQRIAPREDSPRGAPAKAKAPPVTSTTGPHSAKLKHGRTHTNEECRRLRKWAAEHGITISTARISRDVWAAFKADDPDMVDPSRRAVA